MSVTSSLGLITSLALGAAASAAAQTHDVGLAELVQSPVPRSTLEWAHSRVAAGETPPVIQPAHPGDYIQFPFGYGEASVHCARLQVCPIELQAGERLTLP